MAYVNTFEELMSLVEERQNDRLILEVDMGGGYSEEHQRAKEDLQKAEAMLMLRGDDFIGDTLAAQRARVEETRPESVSVWVAFGRIDLKSWSLLVKQGKNMQPIDQYEKALPKTFLGVYSRPECDSNHLLSDDHRLVSSQDEKGILSGGVLNEVISAFMQWQNSGGEVTIHPTKSGQD